MIINNNKLYISCSGTCISVLQRGSGTYFCLRARLESAFNNNLGRFYLVCGIISFRLKLQSSVFFLCLIVTTLTEAIVCLR